MKIENKKLKIKIRLRALALFDSKTTINVTKSKPKYVHIFRHRLSSNTLLPCSAFCYLFVFCQRNIKLSIGRKQIFHFGFRLLCVLFSVVHAAPPPTHAIDPPMLGVRLNAFPCFFFVQSRADSVCAFLSSTSTDTGWRLASVASQTTSLSVSVLDSSPKTKERFAMHQQMEIEMTFYLCVAD